MRFRHLCWVCVVAALLALSLTFPAYADRLQDMLEEGVLQHIGMADEISPVALAFEPAVGNVDFARLDELPVMVPHQIDITIVVMGAPDCTKPGGSRAPTARL
jgi:hypothetical protein